MKKHSTDFIIRHTLAGFCLIAAVGTMTPVASYAVNSAEAQSKATDKKPVTVAGTVYEKATGEALPGASVAIYQNGKFVSGTTTDFEGKFRIIAPTKKCEVKVTFMGMNTETISSSDKNIEQLRIFMQDDTQALQEVDRKSVV